MNYDSMYQVSTHQPLVNGVLDLFTPDYILELGIGFYSTPLFARYVKETGVDYLGVENNQEWINEIKAKYPNLTFTLHELPEKVDINTLSQRLTEEQREQLIEYYQSLKFPKGKIRMLFVDNYTSCRVIAVNTLREKAEIIVVHDCEDKGWGINNYSDINDAGFEVYYYKSPSVWTMVLIKKDLDLGYTSLLKALEDYQRQYEKEHSIKMKLSKYYF